MTPAQFIAKWSPVSLPERAASQEHFIDLCRLLGQPTPAQHDATGAEYAFEKGVSVTGPASRGAKGEGGFADVWWRGKFGWEYKRKDKHKDLTEAYRQLCQYREDLENPPLLIVSDITRTEIHTNFTGTPKQVHVIQLAELDEPENLGLLRRVFADPESFRPTVTTEAVTKEVAKQIASIAQSLRERGHDPHEAAHFLMKCMFCLFAEDVGLLPEALFTRLLNQWHGQSERLTEVMGELFDRMRTGGAFGPEAIAYFNGGLFGTASALPLTSQEAETLLAAARQDWSAVEPAIFGTLFERSLDPAKRSQIGAHYTSRDDIMLVVEPVIMEPLRREWQAVQRQVEKQVERRQKAKTERTKGRANQAINSVLRGFLHRLSASRILDPACGSGNFLYVAIQQLLYLEKEVVRYAAQPEIEVGLLPTVRPTQLHGIEISPYAAELAQVVIWIGYLQWMHENGFNVPRDPILEPLQTIENRDAILDLSDPERPAPAEWPESDFVVGNPPFLGSKLFRQHGLPDDYIQAMYSAFELPNSSDLCCYWFELGRQAIGKHPKTRVGLLATQGIRGGANRTVLERTKETGDIFMAWSDKEWILDGAAVHVSIVGFDNGSEQTRRLDGNPAPRINADLTGGADLLRASPLLENSDIAFMGTTKGGAFDITWGEARALLATPNPTARPNSDVLKPWLNGSDITKRERGMWVMDFGCSMPRVEAAGYEAPFRLVERRVKPQRAKNRRASYARRWWIHVEPRPAMRKSVEALRRFVVTTRVAKHRIFRWFRRPTVPDSATFVFARDDDYFFGVLHSSVHELWARRTGTQLREAESGFRYTPTTCFETFPLPWPPGAGPTEDPPCRRVAEAARELNEMRERWLNPPEWVEPIAAAVDAEDDFSDVPPEAQALIRQSAIMGRAAKDPNLRKRTLTNLYNERPAWLRLAHEQLDRAVLCAYAATDPQGDWSEAWAEVWTETGAGHVLPDEHSLAEKRTEVDKAVLTNLLRLNLSRSGDAGRVHP